MPDFLFNTSALKNIAANQMQKMRAVLPRFTLMPAHSEEVTIGTWSFHPDNFNVLNPLYNLINLTQSIAGIASNTLAKINLKKSFSPTTVRTLIFVTQIAAVAADGY